ncbi:MAG: hypothetical protein ACPKPY_08020 [Nitrososphaeraceae archaeon]
MNPKNLVYMSVLGILAVSVLSASQAYAANEAYATGCPTEFVEEHLQNAKLALEEGNTEEVLNQLTLAEEAIGIVSEDD